MESENTTSPIRQNISLKCSQERYKCSKGFWISLANYTLTSCVSRVFRNEAIHALCLRLFATTVASTLVLSWSHPPQIFVLQIQYFHIYSTVSHICLWRDSISLSDGVPAQRNQWVVHWRLHDMLLLEVLFDDTLMLSTLDLRQKFFVKILFCVLSLTTDDRLRLLLNLWCSSQVWCHFCCWTMFLVLSLLFSTSCWFILSSFSCRRCATQSDTGSSTPREDDNDWSWLDSRVSWTSFAVFLSFVLCHLVCCKDFIMMCSVSDNPEQIFTSWVYDAWYHRTSIRRELMV